MDPKFEDLDSATLIDDEAFHKRRSRRVSFATEITSVHVFDRDDEYDTPPTDNATSSDNVELEEEDNDDEERFDFFRSGDFGTESSPGSAIGSTTSNEEENFFGPVSSSFIKRGRLSDSSMASIDNDEHDITLDSKTFSLHYRSLAQSESGSSLKMPTPDHYTSGDRTPQTLHSAPSGSFSGSFTVVSPGKKPILCSPVSGGVSSAGSDSDAMTMIDTNPYKKYDFGALTPTLQALLAEANKPIAISYGTTGNSLTQGTPVGMNELEARGMELELGGNTDITTPKNDSRSHAHLGRVEDPISEEYSASVSSLKSKRSQLGLVTPVISLSERLDTPFSRKTRKKPPLSTSQNNTCKKTDISSIKNSISKLNVQDSSPRNFTPKAQNQNTDSVVTDHIINTTSTLSVLNENGGFQGLEQSNLSISVPQSHLSSAILMDNELRSETLGVERSNNNTISERSADTDHDLIPNCLLPTEDMKQNHEQYNPNEAALVITEPDLLLQDVACDINRGEQIISTPGKHTPPVNKQMVFTPPELKKLDTLGHRPDLAAAAVDSVGETEAVLVEYRANAVSDRSDDSTSLVKLNFVANNEDMHQNIRNESGNNGDYITPVRPRETWNALSGNSSSHFLTRTDPTNFKEKIAEKASFYGSASAFSFKSTRMATRLEKRLEEDVLQVPSATNCSKLSEGHKRKQANVIDTNLSEELGRIRKSPKVAIEMVLPSLSEFQMEPSPAQTSEVYIKNGHTSTGNCISGTFKSYGTSDLMDFSSIAKLNPTELDKLEDMMEWYQKSNKIEKLQTDIQSKGASDVDKFRMQRVAEAKYMQKRILIEQVKLQISRVKKKQLQKKVQLVHSATLEFQQLKSCYLQHVAVPARQQNKKKEVHPNIIMKRQELENLRKEVKDFSKSIVTSCKIEGEPTPSETIVLANGCLKDRLLRESYRKELQLFEVDKLETGTDRHNLVLSYRGFLLQSFVINLGSASSIITSIKLNDTLICKGFPNINAGVAFAFVFNTDATRKLNGSKSFPVETQMTSALFGNLLDVVEEVQRACEVLRNLTKITFVSASAEQLELQLCFIDFSTGHKVSFTIDISCLNRGLYPSEVLPSQVFATNKSDCSEITKATVDLKAGHTRIIRLCKCVIQILLASSV